MRVRAACARLTTRTHARCVACGDVACDAPLLGATLRQLAPLPLNRPFHPSAFQALSNSS